MSHRGFTFIEMLIVFIIVGLIAAFGLPSIRNAIQSSNVRSARAEMGTLAAKARAIAVARGCVDTLHVSSGTAGTAWITSCKVTGAGLDTVGGVEFDASRWNVSVTPSRTNYIYDPRGIMVGYQAGTIVFTYGTSHDSVTINAVGKVTH
ncbi:MAG TPA: GspH/FimT family pseudopilin [Gemmatimonadales bacterium]|nr:GspH/FimT family pseudopilin [Gemmatimonadales bacterium]